jgi:DNA-binding LacI/PurR family transcriptional regulator
MPTISDIARRAGVSKSTVSYVLSGKRPISEKVRQSVFETMKELGYEQVNPLGRSLATKKSRTIALALPPMSPEHSGSRLDLTWRAEFMIGASEAAMQQGYSLLLWPNAKDEQDLLRMIQQTAVDGLMLMDIYLQDGRVELLKERGHPFCMIGHCQNNDGLSFVDCDYADAMQTCVCYLANLGHQHILFVHTDAPAGNHLGYVTRSLRAFRQTMAACGLQGAVLACEPDTEQCYRLINDTLASMPALSAVITVDAWIVGTLMQVVVDRGIKIPGDLSLVAIASSHLAAITTPRLTIVNVPYVEMGRIGAKQSSASWREKQGQFSGS